MSINNRAFIIAADKLIIACPVIDTRFIIYSTIILRRRLLAKSAM